jgi:PncC family amidohydrolase
MSLRLWVLLRKKGKTLSVAESCTGGLLGQRITAVPGSSDYFMGGIIAYSDRIKTTRLGVSKKSLKKYGAVSKNVAEQMAKNVRRFFKTDYGLSITGIAGPGGGTKTKPVGLVYIAVSTPKKVFCKKYFFRGGRNAVRSQASHQAINLLFKKYS